ncbi:MAG: TrkH family potassium uptake protein [Dehalococcoidia bacterium]|nr:TrkH family potassium uptake protein [Dehalococcoidia bacterium]
MFYPRVKLTLHLIGSILKFLALAYIVPLAVALHYGENWQIFLYSLLLTFIVGIILEFSFKTTREIERADGFSLVSFTWLMVALLGMAPYLFWGCNFIDAFFESMSGFTTTGATILTGLEQCPRSILMWRSLSQWLGGMGVITLFIAILPKLGVGGSQLFAQEFPGPIHEKFRPRVRTVARFLWIIYISFTAIEVGLLYLLAKLPLFDSTCLSFCTLSTGGFTPTTKSIAAYANPTAEYIIMAFMFLAGMNFIIHYRASRGDFKAFKDEEFKIYAILLAAATALLIFSQGAGSCRESLFQTISIMTTTGFATTDFGAWHYGACMILLTLMLIGGCGGSTSGSVKVVRFLTLLKRVRAMMKKVISPKAIILVKYNQKTLPEEILRDTMSFLFLYLIVAVIASITLGFLGLDMETSFSAVAASLGNVGPGLGGVGPASSYAWLPPAAKFVLIICMWLGRLELFTVLMIFVPRFWQR